MQAHFTFTSDLLISNLSSFLLRARDATSELIVVNSDDFVFSRRARVILAYQAFGILSGDLNSLECIRYIAESTKLHDPSEEIRSFVGQPLSPTL